MRRLHPGDRGRTSYDGKTRVRKDHPRIAALGELDELNCRLGAALTECPSKASFAAIRRGLLAAQGRILDLGSRLSVAAKGPARLEEAVLTLEADIALLSKGLPKLRALVLPGGPAPAASLHLARSACRRAERAVAALGPQAPEAGLAYLNRLSDWLFTAARWAGERTPREA